MINKIVGYSFSALGVIGIAAYSIPQVAAELKLPVQFQGISLLIISIVIVLIGLFFIFKDARSSRQAPEVPIFHGKNVVGFRRIGK